MLGDAAGENILWGAPCCQPIEIEKKIILENVSICACVTDVSVRNVYVTARCLVETSPYRQEDIVGNICSKQATFSGFWIEVHFSQPSRRERKNESIEKTSARNELTTSRSAIACAVVSVGTFGQGPSALGRMRQTERAVLPTSRNESEMRWL